MVVIAIGIGCQLQLTIGNTLGRNIAERNAHNAPHIRHKEPGIHALVGVVGHICHVRIATLGKPLVESGGDTRLDRYGLGYAASKKAEVFSLGLYAFTQIS